MGIATIGRTLEDIEAFEQVESAYFGDLAKRARDQGSVLLAGWLAGRSHHVKEILRPYRRSELDVIVKSPIFEEAFERDPRAWFEARTLPDDSGAEALLDVAIDCGRLLLDCARHIAEQRLDRQVLAFATSFQAIALREIKELKKIRALHYF